MGRGAGAGARAARGRDTGGGGRPAAAQAVERGLRASVRARVGTRAVDLRHPREQRLDIQIEESAVAEVRVHPVTIQHDLPDALFNQLVIQCSVNAMHMLCFWINVNRQYSRLREQCIRT